MVAKYNITFPLAQDRGHQIARNAGIYAETDPLWDRLSGFGEAAKRPCRPFYVIGQSQRIAYDFTDHVSFDRSINRRELLSEVYAAGQSPGPEPRYRLNLLHR